MGLASYGLKENSHSIIAFHVSFKYPGEVSKEAILNTIITSPGMRLSFNLAKSYPHILDSIIVIISPSTII